MAEDVPSPDPTRITLAALKDLREEMRLLVHAGDSSVYDRLTTRLDAIDRASEVLAANVNRVPTLLDRVVEQVKEVVNTQFAGVQTQFKERDERIKASDDSSKLAIKDALQAQKESAGATQDNNKAAIDKSEAGFKDQIKALDTQFNAVKESLGTLLNDAKDRITRLETAALTTRDSRVESHMTVGSVTGIIMGAVGVLALLVSLYTMSHQQQSPDLSILNSRLDALSARMTNAGKTP
jgi:hypothetical protein